MTSQQSTGLQPHQLVGTWQLCSFELRSADGEVQAIFGPDPVGMIMYDPQGYMMVFLMRPDRPPFASRDLIRLGATDQEIRTAFGGFDAYCGTYTLDPGQGIVTHHLVGSRFPSWVGTDQVRYIQLSDEELRLSTPPLLIGGKTWTGDLVWQRAPERHAERYPVVTGRAK